MLIYGTLNKVYYKFARLRNSFTGAETRACVAYSHAPLPHSLKKKEKHVKPNPSSRSQRLVILKPMLNYLANMEDAANGLFKEIVVALKDNRVKWGNAAMLV